MNYIFILFPTLIQQQVVSELFIILSHNPFASDTPRTALKNLKMSSESPKRLIDVLDAFTSEQNAI